MSTILDARYDVLAEIFQKQQITILKNTLEKHGIDQNAAQSICKEFTLEFSIFLDQGEIEHNDQTYRPTVAFTPDEETFLIQPGDLEYHEYAIGTVIDIYENASRA